jgi:UDP:flavonoid glycosyltransferase YjiC (YdhE family)
VPATEAGKTPENTDVSYQEVFSGDTGPLTFAIAVHGTRGDIEPCAAVALELRRRGHEVRLAVPPNLVAFVASAGVGTALPYGVDSQKQLENDLFRDFWKVQNPMVAVRRGREYIAQGWPEMTDTLRTMSDGADLILTGTTYEEVAANIAEHRGIPLAALHYFPFRENSQLVPVPLPARVRRAGFAVAEWVHWRILKQPEDVQRDELGLPKAEVRAIRRILEGGALEIQAYDEVLFPGLGAEWRGVRPLVGSLSLELPTPDDDALMEWITAGPPPIYFGFGSMPVDSPAEAIATISAVCAELGERALISTGVWDVAPPQDDGRVRLVGAVHHAKVFPHCRAVVHHGGAGTTAAGVRAGVPTVVLWVGADQPVWAGQIRRLKIGVAQRFSRMTARSLTAGLRAALAPECAQRAKAAGRRMTTAAQSTATTADLLEAAARRGRVPVHTGV